MAMLSILESNTCEKKTSDTLQNGSFHAKSGVAFSQVCNTCISHSCPFKGCTRKQKTKQKGSSACYFEMRINNNYCFLSGSLHFLRSCYIFLKEMAPTLHIVKIKQNGFQIRPNIDRFVIA